MLGGASQIVSMIRVKYNGKNRTLTSADDGVAGGRAGASFAALFEIAHRKVEMLSQDRIAFLFRQHALFELSQHGRPNAARNVVVGARWKRRAGRDRSREHGGSAALPAAGSGGSASQRRGRLRRSARAPRRARAEQDVQIRDPIALVAAPDRGPPREPDDKPVIESKQKNTMSKQKNRANKRNEQQRNEERTDLHRSAASPSSFIAAASASRCHTLKSAARHRSAASTFAFSAATSTSDSADVTLPRFLRRALLLRARDADAPPLEEGDRVAGTPPPAAPPAAARAAARAVARCDTRCDAR